MIVREVYAFVSRPIPSLVNVVQGEDDTTRLSSSRQVFHELTFNFFEELCIVQGG